MNVFSRLFNSNKSDEYLIDVFNNTMDEQNGLISQVHRDPANKGARSRIEDVGDKLENVARELSDRGYNTHEVRRRS